MMIEEVTRAFERLVIVASAPLLLYIGYRLFVMGATGVMQLSASTGTWKAKATNLSPGAFCFALSVALGIYVLNSKLVIERDPQGGVLLEFGGGRGPADIPPSVVMRARFGNVYLCTARGEDLQTCLKTQFLTHYKRVIDETTLSRIEALEKSARDSVDDRRALLKLIKDLSI